jgi:hypothetical protein
MQVKKKKKKKKRGQKRKRKRKQSWNLKLELGKIRVLDRGSVGLIFENHCGLPLGLDC